MLGKKEEKGRIKQDSKNINKKKLEKKIELHENGKIKFEGTYLNGKRCGKGTEYDNNCNIIFEGNYLNGERNGEGKEYYYLEYTKKQLKFEGEYKNGMKWTGKGYDKNGKVLYELKDGQGIIKEYYDNGKIKYEGRYFNGEKNGQGKEYFSNGHLLFEGEYKNGIKWTGKGFDKNGKVLYELKNGNGPIKEFELGELIFEGEYKNGKRNGKGKEYYFSNALKFEGEYLNGIRNGKAKEYKYGKLIFEGKYLNDKKWNGIVFATNGNKEYEIKNGTRIIENVTKDNKNNEGGKLLGKSNEKRKIYNLNHKSENGGELLNNEKNGNIKECSLEKLENEIKYVETEDFIGELKNGKRWNGRGKEYGFIYNEQYLEFEGEYKEGKYWNGKGEFRYDVGGMGGIIFKTYKCIKGKIIYDF